MYLRCLSSTLQASSKASKTCTPANNLRQALPVECAYLSNQGMKVGKRLENTACGSLRAWLSFRVCCCPVCTRYANRQKRTTLH